MSNYAEELAYWYLRLNGFFVMKNFVLHNRGLDSSQNADIDLLAIRNKYTFEEVGGQQADPDHELFKFFDPKKNIELLVEVKSGGYKSIRLGNIDRLRYGVQRLGFFSHNKANCISQKLLMSHIAEGDFHQIGKLLISGSSAQESGFICLTLDSIETFIVNHLKKYAQDKYGARHFFHSDLIQYLSWKNKLD